MFLKNSISWARSAILLCAISAVATHHIARTTPTGRVNRPNNIASPPPTSTTTAKTQAASTIGRPCLTNIACVAAGPSSLIVPPMRNKRLSSTRPRSIVAFSGPRIFRTFYQCLGGHYTAYPKSFSSYHQHPNRQIVGCCGFRSRSRALDRLIRFLRIYQLGFSIESAPEDKTWRLRGGLRVERDLRRGGTCQHDHRHAAHCRRDRDRVRWPPSPGGRCAPHDAQRDRVVDAADRNDIAFGRHDRASTVGSGHPQLAGRVIQPLAVSVKRGQLDAISKAQS